MWTIPVNEQEIMQNIRCFQPSLSKPLLLCNTYLTILFLVIDGVEFTLSYFGGSQKSKDQTETCSLASCIHQFHGAGRALEKLIIHPSHILQSAWLELNSDLHSHTTNFFLPLWCDNSLPRYGLNFELEVIFQTNMLSMSWFCFFFSCPFFDPRQISVVTECIT